MVHRGVAGAGSTLLLAALALSLVATALEDWVRLALAGVASCTASGPTPLGTLGLFTASLQPSCTEGSRFEDEWGPSLTANSVPFSELAVLFPAQNAFGGQLGPGLDFTSCDAAFGQQQSPARVAARRSVIAQAETAVFAPADATVEAVATLARSNIFAATGDLDQALFSIWRTTIRADIPTVQKTALDIALNSMWVDQLLSHLVTKGELALLPSTTFEKLPLFQSIGAVFDLTNATNEQYFGEQPDLLCKDVALDIATTIAKGLSRIQTGETLTKREVLLLDSFDQFLGNSPLTSELTNQAQIDERADQLLLRLNPQILAITSVTAATFCGEELPKEITFPEAVLSDVVSFQDDFANKFELTPLIICTFSRLVSEVSEIIDISFANVSSTQQTARACVGFTLNACSENKLAAIVPPQLSNTEHRLAQLMFNRFEQLIRTILDPPLLPTVATVLDLLNVLNRAIATKEIANLVPDHEEVFGNTLRSRMTMLEEFMKECQRVGLGWDASERESKRSCQAAMFNRNMLPTLAFGGDFEATDESYDEQFSIPEDWQTLDISACQPAIEQFGTDRETGIEADRCNFADFLTAMHELESNGSNPPSSSVLGFLHQEARRLESVRLITEFCADAGAGSRSACAQELSGSAFDDLNNDSSQTIVEFLTAIDVQVFARFYNGVESIQDLVEACEADDSDRGMLAAVQALLPVGSVFVFAALVLSVMLAYSRKVLFGKVAGTLAICGCVIWATAQIIIHMTTLFEQVGVTQDEGRVENAAGLAPTLLTCAIILACGGGALVVGSTFCFQEDKWRDAGIKAFSSI